MLARPELLSSVVLILDFLPVPGLGGSSNVGAVLVLCHGTLYNPRVSAPAHIWRPLFSTWSTYRSCRSS